MEPITSVTVTPKVEINGELRSVNVVSHSVNENTGYRQLLIEIPLNKYNTIVSEIEFAATIVADLREQITNLGLEVQLG